MSKPPIKPKIIVSKVKSLLRRLKKEEISSEKIQLGKLIIDKDQYIVTHKGKTYSLPRKEFELLYLLASKPNKVVKREKILDGIGRVRNDVEGPEGYLYLGIEGMGIVKILPAK